MDYLRNLFVTNRHSMFLNKIASLQKENEELKQRNKYLLSYIDELKKHIRPASSTVSS